MTSMPTTFYLEIISLSEAMFYLIIMWVLLAFSRNDLGQLSIMLSPAFIVMSLSTLISRDVPLWAALLTYIMTTFLVFIASMELWENKVDSLFNWIERNYNKYHRIVRRSESLPHIIALIVVIHILGLGG